MQGLCDITLTDHSPGGNGKEAIMDEDAQLGIMIPIRNSVFRDGFDGG